MCNNCFFRAPMTVQEREREIYRKGMEELNKPIEPPPRRHHRRRRPGGYYRPAIGGAIYNIYPIMYPKGADYCPQMRGIFRFTCQPSKPLRLDLVEFCKEYSAFCGVINTHRLPGPGIGPRGPGGATGHIGVSGNFGFRFAFVYLSLIYIISLFSIGSVPGLEVNAGWGVDVGPLPGVGDSIGINVDSGVGLLGASPPLKYRMGKDKPTDAKSGLVGKRSFFQLRIKR